MRYKELVLKKLQQLEGEIKNVELSVSRGESPQSTQNIIDSVYSRIVNIVEYVTREEED